MPKVEIKVKNLSGFDKSFKNLLTTKVGTLTPILCDEVVPGIIDHELAINASLPPLASDTYMNCNLKVEAFFVPHRLLYAGFWPWMTNTLEYDDDAGDYGTVGIPVLRLDTSGSSISQATTLPFLGSGKLSDYLGFRTAQGTGGYAQQDFNIFPFLAYHRIYDDWYRNALVQTPVFSHAFNVDLTSTVPLSYLPYISVGGTQAFVLSDTFPDSVSLGDLRQRNFGFDYFTCALPSAQLGNPNGVVINSTVSGSGATGFMSIASLRAANSMQQFAERQVMAGPREQDFIKANYGVDLSSGVAQRCILIGSGEIPVYSKGIYQNNNYDGTTATQNPFETHVGAEYGSVVCSGKIKLADNFHVDEPGYYFVMASLVPKVTYSSGIERSLLRYRTTTSQSDMANALLENVGMQPIFSTELTGEFAQLSSVFGYADRYADWKHRNDELHGLVRDGESLQSFALQRTVTGTPSIGSGFLQIPTSYLDQVAAVNGEVSTYGCWMDCYHSYKVVMPLSSYSIPSLQDPAYEHGKSVNIDLGGSRI